MTRLIAALAIACALSTQLAAQNKPLITPKDYGKWELLGAPRLSPRGRSEQIEVLDAEPLQLSFVLPKPGYRCTALHRITWFNHPVYNAMRSAA